MSISVDEIERYLEEIPDDADRVSDFDDFQDDEDELIKVTSPLDLAEEIEECNLIDISNLDIEFADETIDDLCNQPSTSNIYDALITEKTSEANCSTENVTVQPLESQNISKKQRKSQKKTVTKRSVVKTKKTKKKKSLRNNVNDAVFEQDEPTNSQSNASESHSESEDLRPHIWHKKTNVETIRPESGRAEGVNEIEFVRCKTPTDVFMVFMESILDDLVYQTNLYGTQQNKTLRIQREDMLVFIGINFLMGYHHVPSYKDFWSTSPDLGVKIVSDAMSRDTFEKILVNLHCNDNTLLPPNNKDKLFKVRPIIEKLNASFKRNYFGTKQVSVDESMIKFKGRSSLKQFNPMKPIKRGYKIWSLADQKGYMLAFKVYQGKEEIINPDFESYGLGERVVLELTKPIWNNYREIYFDNYFSSPALVQKLKLEKTLACGTVRINRKGLPPGMAPDKKLKRGEYDSKFLPDGISFYKWMDNNGSSDFKFSWFRSYNC